MKNLKEIHQDVRADHYDVGIKKNLFQKYWHSKRFKELLSLIEPVLGAVLDVGCHGGTFTQKILEKIGSKEIYGVDISASAVKLASNRLPFGKFQVVDAHQLPFKDNFFDAVFCLEMLEHVDDPIKVLQEIKRVIKKDQRIYLMIPTESKLFKIIWALWTLYYPVWKHAHVQDFYNGGLDRLIKEIGLKIINKKTFHLGMLEIIVCKK